MVKERNDYEFYLIVGLLTVPGLFKDLINQGLKEKHFLNESCAYMFRKLFELFLNKEDILTCDFQQIALSFIYMTGFKTPQIESWDKLAELIMKPSYDGKENKEMKEIRNVIEKKIIASFIENRRLFNSIKSKYPMKDFFEVSIHEDIYNVLYDLDEHNMRFSYEAVKQALPDMFSDYVDSLCGLAMDEETCYKTFDEVYLNKFGYPEDEYYGMEDLEEYEEYEDELARYEEAKRIRSEEEINTLLYDTALDMANSLTALIKVLRQNEMRKHQYED